jgi:CDGSH-type Zn-finger protein
LPRQPQENAMTTAKSGPRVQVSNDGPYIVSGAVPLAQQSIVADAAGESQDWKEGRHYKDSESYALCRCGHSRTKPFCDGSHVRARFDGSETASRAAYVEQAVVFDGPMLVLTDAESLCAFGRFCDPNGKVWNEVAQTDNPKVAATFLRQVQNCPAGRLVAWDKRTREPLEPQLPPSIGLIEDPVEQCSGPIWLRGGIPVESATAFATKCATASPCAVAARRTTSRSATAVTPRSSSRRSRYRDRRHGPALTRNDCHAENA